MQLALQVGSPTALVDDSLTEQLLGAALHHGLYISNGALWGGDDIQKMADTGTLQVSTVEFIMCCRSVSCCSCASDTKLITFT